MQATTTNKSNRAQNLLARLQKTFNGQINTERLKEIEQEKLKAIYNNPFFM